MGIEVLGEGLIVSKTFQMPLSFRSKYCCRFVNSQWQYWSFVGSKWNRILKEERKKYLKNAYRVLLTRARQGMVIVIPPGNDNDPTRLTSFYNPTYEYLKSVGFEVIE